MRDIKFAIFGFFFVLLTSFVILNEVKDLSSDKATQEHGYAIGQTGSMNDGRVKYTFYRPVTLSQRIIDSLDYDQKVKDTLRWKAYELVWERHEVK